MFFYAYIYAGSVFGVDALKGNIYFNSIVGIVAEFLGYLLIEPFLKRFKRLMIMRFAFLIIFCASIPFIFIKVPEACLLK